KLVTGVQTCALPISGVLSQVHPQAEEEADHNRAFDEQPSCRDVTAHAPACGDKSRVGKEPGPGPPPGSCTRCAMSSVRAFFYRRSEERRVGKECRSR